MGKKIPACSIGLVLILFMPLPGFAETVYIDDKVVVGLHRDKDIDSPITKTLVSGTALELLKRDTPLSQVTEPGGASGWIDNRYLTDTAPGLAQLQQLQEKAGKLEAELSALKAAAPNASAPAGADAQNFSALAKENEELNQQLQSERLKTGELQAQAAELRNQLSQAATRSGADANDAGTGDDSAAAVPAEKPGFNPGERGWRFILASVLVCIAVGMAGGIFFMDWLNRRRHGGFRV